MNNQNYEPEISLGKVFYRIFRDWRKIFIAAVAVAIAVGAAVFAFKMIGRTSEYLEKAEKNYELELAAFEAQGETLAQEIANLEEAEVRQEAYNENSVLMKINPFREFNASVQLYVATDYQIIPDLVYQNPDLSSRILRSYSTYMTNGDMYQYILGRLSQPMELRYLLEVLSVSVDYDSRMLVLGVRHVDAASCEEILGYALEGIYAKQQEITAAVGEHTLNAINQSSYEAVNFSLDSTQKSNRQYLLDLSVAMQEKTEALTEWERTPKPRPDHTIGRIVKNSIKMMILGFLAGGFLAAAFVAFRYIMSDRLQDVKDLKGRFGLRVIAQIPKVHQKRAWVMFDRLFAKMGGLALKEDDAVTLAKVAAQSVGAELEAQMADAVARGENPAGQSKSVSLAFTGSVAVEEIDRLLSDMEWGRGYSVKSVASILRDPLAVPAVMGADYVVLVEKQEESTYTQIGQELEELAAWKKKVLGVIVVGVDAVP